jgi:hypothetical protein
MVDVERTDTDAFYCGPRYLLHDATRLYLKAEALSLRFTGGETWEFSNQQERELFVISSHLEEAGSIRAFREKYNIAETDDVLKGMLFDRVVDYLSTDVFRSQHDHMSHAISTVFEHILPQDQEIDTTSEFLSLQNPWLLKTRAFKRTMTHELGSSQDDGSSDLLHTIAWVQENSTSVGDSSRSETLLHDVVVSDRLFTFAKEQNPLLKWDAAGIRFITGDEVLLNQPLITYWDGIGDIPRIREFINQEVDTPNGIRVLSEWTAILGKLANRLQKMESELCEGHKWEIPNERSIWVKVWSDSVTQLLEEYERRQPDKIFWRIEKLMEETLESVTHQIHTASEAYLFLPLMVRFLPKGDADGSKLVSSLYNLYKPNEAQDRALADVIEQLKTNRHVFERVPMLNRVRIAELAFNAAGEEKKLQWLAQFPSSRNTLSQEDMTWILHTWSEYILSTEEDTSTLYRAAEDSWNRHLNTVGLVDLSTIGEGELLKRALTSMINAIGMRRTYFLLFERQNGDSLIESLNEKFSLQIKYTQK